MRHLLPTLTLCAATLATPALADKLEKAALAGINAQRAQAGCGALVLNPALQAAAKGHATAMAIQNFFSHTGKDGSDLQSRINAVGYRWSGIAENIAAGQPSADKVVAEWMGSAGHRKNILNCSYSETGLALVYQPDDQPIKGHSYPFKYYWVQTFGSP